MESHIPSKLINCSVLWITPKKEDSKKTKLTQRQNRHAVHVANVESLKREIKADVWTMYINNRVRKKDIQGIDLPPLIQRSGSGVTQLDLEKAEECNGQYPDVFNKKRQYQVLPQDRSAPFMEFTRVSKGGVAIFLKGLNISKSLGPGEPHPRVVKKLATELSLVIANIFQQSIDKRQMKSQRDGLSQISARFSRKNAGHLRAIIV